jgi:peptidoglycan/LPS O-acetylase OafA/YrhL
MQPNRQAYLDWLRILAIFGVLFFHSAMPFVAEWDWHIKNKETSNLMMEMNFFLGRFRMPLLFFISGAVAFYMLQKRTSAQFIGLRFRRLLIPLVFGMLTIVPLQVYMERLNQGFEGNFFEFYPTIFSTGPYPEGNMSWHHLWFIAYLFVYDVILAPVFKWFTANHHRLTFFHWLDKGKRIYLITLPSVILFALLTLSYPETNDLINDWCRIFYWMFFLLAGFICISLPSLMESLERNRRISVTVGFITIILINYLRWNSLEPLDVIPNAERDIRTYLYLSLYAITAWSWVFALAGYGKKYLNRQHRSLSYLNTAVYPFYILHQTVIVVLAWYVVRTTDSILMKYIFIVTATFFISVVTYHFFIRPFTLTRFLFGAKKANHHSSRPEPKKVDMENKRPLLATKEELY